jgi:membrane associated rhomboid family serine protease
MAWHDRDYNRTSSQPSGGFGGGSGGGIRFGMGGFSWSSATGMLLIANIAVFFVDMMTTGRGENFGPVKAMAAFSYDQAIGHFQVWRFFTYQFLHADITHILFNMVGLYSFGPLVENYLGSRRYLAFYLICGLAGAALYLLFLMTGILGISSASVLVGASGSIMGLLAGAAIIAPPNTQAMLMIPPVPVKLRTLAYILLAVSAFVALTRGNNAGGEAAHLGGILMGFFLIKRSGLLNFADAGARRSGSGPRAPRDMGDFGPASGTSGSQRMTFAQKVANYRQERARKQQEAMEKEIDRILIKVKEKGLHSLTDSEKATLQRETERKRGQ